MHAWIGWAQIKQIRPHLDLFEQGEATGLPQLDKALTGETGLKNFAQVRVCVCGCRDKMDRPSWPACCKYGLNVD